MAEVVVSVRTRARDAMLTYRLLQMGHGKSHELLRRNLGIQFLWMVSAVG
jgi:hypothetical protein